MKFRTRISAALAGSGLVLSGLALAAPAAHATTADCRAALGNQCGTFAGHDNEATPAPVFWDVRGKTSAVGAVVIGYSADSTSDAATDITPVEHVGHVVGVGLSDQNTISYSFVYTPGGHWSNLCIADPGDGTGLALRTCNGLQWQRFFADRGVTPGDPPEQIGGTGGTFNGNSIYFGSTSFGYSLQNAASRQFVSDDSVHTPGARPAGADDRQLVTDTVSLYLGLNQVWNWIATTP
jgi:hypothetical protein